MITFSGVDEPGRGVPFDFDRLLVASGKSIDTSLDDLIFDACND